MADVGRKTIRGVKNIVGGYSEIQIKVRKATSNDPSGPAGHNLQELAAGTYNNREFAEIMDMLDKRLNDSGKNWRHVYKALIVLDYLLHCGSEQVVAYTKENIHIIKTLKEFQYIDENGRDQGANVRQKVKEVTSLLADENRIREERGNGSAGRANSVTAGTKEGDYYNEDSEVAKALEASRKTALLDERKRLESQKSERELQMVIEMSEEEAKEARRKEGPIQDDYNSGAVNYVTPQQYGYDPFANFNQNNDAYNQQLQMQQQQQQYLQQQDALRQQQLMDAQRHESLRQQQAMQQQQIMMQNAASSAGNPFGASQQQPSRPNPFNIQPQQTGDRPSARTGVNTIDPFASISSSRSSTVTQPTALKHQHQPQIASHQPNQPLFYQQQAPATYSQPTTQPSFVNYSRSGNSVKSHNIGLALENDLRSLGQLAPSSGYTHQQAKPFGVLDAFDSVSASGYTGSIIKSDSTGNSLTGRTRLQSNPMTGQYGGITGVANAGGFAASMGGAKNPFASQAGVEGAAMAQMPQVTNNSMQNGGQANPFGTKDTFF